MDRDIMKDYKKVVKGAILTSYKTPEDQGRAIKKYTRFTPTTISYSNRSYNSEQS